MEVKLIWYIQRLSRCPHSQNGWCIYIGVVLTKLRDEEHSYVKGAVRHDEAQECNKSGRMQKVARRVWAGFDDDYDESAKSIGLM